MGSNRAPGRARGAESTAGRYGAVRYAGRAVALAHPARIAAVAGLFGVPAPPPRRAVVADIGCGRGASLLPIAAGLPSASVWGVDAEGSAIQECARVATAAGLTNVSVAEGLIGPAAMSELDGEVDYVLLHGVLSWVPAQTRVDALEMVSRLLRPGGIAYISYNALPGWHLLQEPRRIARRAVAAVMEAGDPDPEEVASLAIEALEEAARLHGGSGTYGAVLRDAIERYSSAPPWLLFHDDLAEVCEPFHLADVVELCSSVGLGYLAEAHPDQWWAKRLPPSAANELRSRADDPGARQSLADSYSGVSFKASLFVKGPDVNRSDPLADPPQELWLAPEDGQDPVEALDTEAPPAQRQAAEAVAALGPVFSLEQLGDHLGCDPRSAYARAIKLATDRRIGLWATRPPVETRVSEHPNADPLSRVDAGEGDEVRTLLQTTLRIEDAEVRALIGLLDGTRTTEALIAALSEETDRPPEALDGPGRAALESFARLGLLSPPRPA